MVTTDTTQLNRECNAWREQLRSYRETMGQLHDQLQELARHQQDKEVLSEVEHYYNQFYIQQVNIHDLKQAIKLHERKMLLEQGPGDHPLTDQTLSEHEQLNDRYESLEQTIRELVDDFGHFSGRA
ncbi:MAG TPA: hypothetical protein PKE63_05565 [Lacibacter sp.]|nr:hypothetical protein [Lacibacter sp.]HMO90358.1 hypothetical protein [Lacibacter sp.]HMP86724.1 hypothetical protein [Lacibacter sp.]